MVGVGKVEGDIAIAWAVDEREKLLEEAELIMKEFLTPLGSKDETWAREMQGRIIVWLKENEQWH